MKSLFLMSLLLFATPLIAQEKLRMEDSYPRWAKAQKYVGTEVEPIDCFRWSGESSWETCHSTAIFCFLAGQQCEMLRDTRKDRPNR